MRRRTSEERMSSPNTIDKLILELNTLKYKRLLEGRFTEADDIELRIKEDKTNYTETMPIYKAADKVKKDSDFYIYAYINTKACWGCPICEERLIQHIFDTVNSQTTMPLHIESLVQELAKRAKDHLERHATGEIGDGDNNSSSNDEPEVSGENNSTT